MNYYIQGNKEKADQIKAAFEAKGYKCAHNCDSMNFLYYTINNHVTTTGIQSHTRQLIMRLAELGDYSELKLPVEPKFKIGDWIACDADSFTLSIKSVRDVNYYFHQGESLPIKYIDEHYHLWSIADAKEGDVLAINWHEDNDSWEKIIIFKNYHAKGVKGLLNSPCVEGYGNTFKNGKLVLQEEVPYYSKTWTMALQPATREQRDLLFQEMKKNDCEWDAEKKELRKIFEPQFKVGDDIKQGSTIETIAEIDYTTRSYICESGRTIWFENQDMWHLAPKPHYDIANLHAGMPVLVRDYVDEEWSYVQFSHIRKLTHALVFNAGCNNWYQCIPYNDDTKHLLGTTDKPDEMYINW